MAKKVFEPKLLSITIDNNQRLSAGYTISEYIFIQFVLFCKANGYQYSRANAKIFFGMSESEFMTPFYSLQAKNLAGFITRDGKKSIEISQAVFDSFVSTFEEFMAPHMNVSWGSGSRKNAETLFNQLAKKLGSGYLNERKKAYFSFLDSQRTIRKFDRATMGAPVFLNPKNALFQYNWEDEDNKVRSSALKDADPIGQKEAGKSYEEMFTEKLETEF